MEEPKILENRDIILTQDELFEEVSQNSGISKDQVAKIMDVFIQVQLKNLKLI